LTFVFNNQYNNSSEKNEYEQYSLKNSVSFNQEGYIWGMANISSNVYKNGIWLNAVCENVFLGEFNGLYAYISNDGAEWRQIAFLVSIPEPATMALLCFGGLLLRKK
jgi:hypothetical protein